MESTLVIGLRSVAGDEAVPEGDAERFAELYSRAGGLIELGKYPGEPHGFMRQDTPNAARAFALNGRARQDSARRGSGIGVKPRAPPGRPACALLSGGSRGKPRCRRL